MLKTIIAKAMADTQSMGGGMVPLTLGPSSSMERLVPVEAEDIEEVLRSTVSSSTTAAAPQYYCAAGSSGAGSACIRSGVAALLQPPPDVVMPSLDAEGGTADRARLGRMLAALAHVSPRWDVGMNPFYAIANGFGAIVRDADHCSQKLEWICKGFAANQDQQGAGKGGAGDAMAFVGCDVVVVPKGMQLGEAVFAQSASPCSSSPAACPRGMAVTGYIVVVVEGSTQWRIPKGGGKSSTTLSSGPRTTHYVPAGGAFLPSHEGSADSGAVLCVFKCFGAPTFEATFRELVVSSLDVPPAGGKTPKGGGGARDLEAKQFAAAKDALVKGLSLAAFSTTRADMVQQRVTQRAAAVKRDVVTVQMPLSALTRLRWSPAVKEVLDFREWRKAARARFDSDGEDGDPQLDSALWADAVRRFEEANPVLCAAGVSHLIALRRGDGTVFQFRCSLSVGKAALLLHHRSPATIALPEFSGGGEPYQAIATVAALAAMGLVVRVQF